MRHVDDISFAHVQIHSMTQRPRYGPADAQGAHKCDQKSTDYPRYEAILGNGFLAATRDCSSQNDETRLSPRHESHIALLATRCVTRILLPNHLSHGRWSEPKQDDKARRDTTSAPRESNPRHLVRRSDKPQVEYSPRGGPLTVRDEAQM